jgi:hypothetical protein
MSVRKTEKYTSKTTLKTSGKDHIHSTKDRKLDMKDIDYLSTHRLTNVKKLRASETSEFYRICSNFDRPDRNYYDIEPMDSGVQSHLVEEYRLP